MQIARFGFVLAILGWTTGLLLGQTVPTDLDSREFRYVVQPEPPAARHYRSIQAGLPGGLIRKQLLEDLDPEFNSTWQLGWFTYGDGNSRSVAVAQRGESPHELFVDIDRSKRLTEEERIHRDPEDPHRWQVAISAEFLTEDNQYAHHQRSIFIRQSSRQGPFEIATQGVMQGSVVVDGRRMLAVRVDRDSNGRWFDSRDRIMLDTNGDGKVDPIGERFACEAVCRIKNKRFVMQSDKPGQRLGFVELSGLGSIVARLKTQSDSAEIGHVSGAMVSRDGVRVTLRGVDQPIECPVGDYRIESLTLEVSDGQLNYWYQFSSYASARHTTAVKAGQPVAVDLLGELTLKSSLSTIPGQVDTTLSITPWLETSSGLYLSGCKTGRRQPTLENRLLTQSVLENQIIDNGSTGFS